MIEKVNLDWWQGRVDSEDGESGLRWHQIVQAYDSKQTNSFVFVGFASEEGVRRNKGRIGAAAAPQEIRKFLSGIPYHQTGLILQDAGNVVCQGAALEQAREEQVNLVSQLIKEGQKPIVLGGGHEVAFGDFAAVAQTHKNIGIINIDAHFDLRKPSPKTTSGTGFYEMSQMCILKEIPFNYLCLGIQKLGNTKALFDKADELGVEYILADDIHENRNWINQLLSFNKRVDALYLTLDIDALDVAYAPGVSATCINGLTPNQVKNMLNVVGDSGKLKLMDVAEVNPKFDIDHRTSKLAAQMIASLIEGW